MKNKVAKNNDDPAAIELRKYKEEYKNSPYGKLEQLVALAEDVKKAFGGAVTVAITFQK
jgi:hypothetical protein